MEWKEEVVAYCDVITCHLPGRTEEDHDAFCQVATLETGI
jgi:surfactin synthase thioesterase subunit